MPAGGRHANLTSPQQIDGALELLHIVGRGIGAHGYLLFVEALIFEGTGDGHLDNVAQHDRQPGCHQQVITPGHLRYHQHRGNGHPGGTPEYSRHPHDHEGSRRLVRDLSQETPEHCTNEQARCKDTTGATGREGKGKSDHLGKD